MKRLIVLTALIFLVAGPAHAQQTRARATALQRLTNAKLLNAYNRLYRAQQKNVATAPTGPQRSPSGAFANANPAIPGSSALLPATLTPPATDRPFDANAPVVDPFAVAAAPGSFLSPPFMPGPGVDPFGPGLAPVNPFLPSWPSATYALPANVLDSSAILAGNPGAPLPAGQNFLGARKSPPLQLRPLEGLLPLTNPFISSPSNTVPPSDPMALMGSLYSLDFLFRGSSSRIPSSP